MHTHTHVHTHTYTHLVRYPAEAGPCYVQELISPCLDGKALLDAIQQGGGAWLRVRVNDLQSDVTHHKCGNVASKIQQ